MGCLYQLTSPSGKSYIGISSKTAEDRWRVHNMRVREGRSHALQQAIRKYGAEMFVLKTLVIADDWEYLCEMEVRAIATLKTITPHGYNLTKGGEGVVGRVLTAVASENMSTGQRKRFQRPDQREILLRNGVKGRQVLSASCKASRDMKRAARLAYLSSDAYKRSHSDATKAGMARPEVAGKVKAAAVARAADPEWRTKISRSKTGASIAPCSDAARANHSIGAKRMWERRKAANA